MARTKPNKPHKTPIPAPKALDPLPQNTQALLRTGPEAVAYHIPISPPTPSHPLLKTTVCLPRYSTWASGLHFHTAHTEYLHLTHGCIFVSLNDTMKIYSAETGGEVHWITGQLVKEGLLIKVPKYARHNWGRADEYAWGERGKPQRTHICPSPRFTRPRDISEEVVVEEWTDPSDVGKALFFWNLNGVINGDGGGRLTVLQRLVRLVMGCWWVPFQLFVVFWELDNWPVFLALGYQDSPGVGGRLWVRVYRWVEYVMTFGVLFGARAFGWLVGVRAVEKIRTPEKLWEAYQAQGV